MFLVCFAGDIFSIGFRRHIGSQIGGFGKCRKMKDYQTLHRIPFINHRSKLGNTFYH